ncbi:MAG: RcnB family protein [Novosphingobium sp.]
MIMAKWSFMKSGGKAAIAAGIAFIALPSMAMADQQDGNRWNRGGGEARDGSEARGGGERRGSGEGRGNWQQRQQVQQAQQAPVQQAQVQQAQVQQAQPQQAQQQAAQQQQRGNWQQRQQQNTNQQVRGYQGGENRTVPWVGRSEQRNDTRSGNNDGWRGRNDQRADPNIEQRRVEQRRGDDRRSDGWRNDGRNNQWQDNNRRSGGWSGNNNNHREWNRDWRRDNRYNWSGWRSNNRNTFHLGSYYAPYRGWNYRRLGIGVRLESLFFGQNYWISDPWSYRLPEAYGPYRWVRYYDDALLVNIYDGEVVDVIYNIFW